MEMVRRRYGDGLTLLYTAFPLFTIFISS